MDDAPLFLGIPRPPAPPAREPTRAAALETTSLCDLSTPVAPAAAFPIRIADLRGRPPLRLADLRELEPSHAAAA